MVRVFVSSYTPGLKPGQGSLIAWEIGERTRVIEGVDEGRIFVVESEGMRHNDAPPGEFVREGYFEDDPERTRWAKLERALWFVEQPEPFNMLDS